MASVSFEEEENPDVDIDPWALQAEARARFLRAAFDWEEATFLGAGRQIDAEEVHQVFAFAVSFQEDKIFTFPRMVGTAATVDRNFTVILNTGHDYYLVSSPGDKWHFTGIGDPNFRAMVNVITTPHFLEHEIPFMAETDGHGVYLLGKPGNTYYLRLLPNDQQARAALLDTNLPIPAEPNHQLWHNVGQLHQIILHENQSYQINIHGNNLATGNLVLAILLIRVN